MNSKNFWEKEYDRLSNYFKLSMYESYGLNDIIEINHNDYTVFIQTRKNREIIHFNSRSFKQLLKDLEWYEKVKKHYFKNIDLPL